MNKKRMEIMKKISQLPKGKNSPSKKYWCLTCKKLFVLDKAECPYMTKMCVNTPIAIEQKPPESTISLERFGLFYPKFPLQLMNLALVQNLEEKNETQKSNILKKIGQELVKTYITFLDEWKIDFKTEPLQTIKSLILFFSGCETAQRNLEDSFIFLVMDVEKVWNKKYLITILQSAIEVIGNLLNIQTIIGKPIKIETIDLFTHLKMGKYFCTMCSMFFEFGPKKENVSCPLMPQKCMFSPTDISKMEYTPDMMEKIYRITPDIYKKIMKIFPKLKDPKYSLTEILNNEWGFKLNSNDEVVNKIAKSIGLL